MKLFELQMVGEQLQIKYLFEPVRFTDKVFGYWLMPIDKPKWEKVERFDADIDMFIK